jgi:hypothetical protein
MAQKQKLEINYAYQKAVSFSQYSMYSNCQYSWYLAYVKKQKVFKPGIHLLYGTSLHEAMQEYLRLMYDESVKAADEMDLVGYFEERMYENYKNDLVENKNEHYTNKNELMEFIEDGKASLEWFKSKRSKYFSKKGTKLIGIEIPILQSITEYAPNVLLQGYIDFILYHEADDSYTIYDIKTSTRGWTDKEKKDENKVNQILFYKKFYSKALEVPEDKINVEFFIIKRKIYENAEFPIPRIQQFVPANGKIKVKKAYESLENFVKECFTPEAKYNTDRTYVKNTSACKYCPYNDKPELCDKKN